MQTIVKKSFTEAIKEIRDINESRNSSIHLYKSVVRGIKHPVRKYALFGVEGKKYIIKIYEGAEVRLLARQNIVKAVSRFSTTRYKKPQSYSAAKQLKQLF